MLSSFVSCDQSDRPNLRCGPASLSVCVRVCGGRGALSRSCTHVACCSLAPTLAWLAAFPHLRTTLAQLSQTLLEKCELAGEEPSEALLLARMACIAAGRGVATEGETAFESYLVPRQSRDECPSDEGLGGDEEFLSFRVANQDNEVRPHWQWATPRPPSGQRIRLDSDCDDRQINLPIDTWKPFAWALRCRRTRRLSDAAFPLQLDGGVMALISRDAAVFCLEPGLAKRCIYGGVDDATSETRVTFLARLGLDPKRLLDLG